MSLGLQPPKRLTFLCKQGHLSELPLELDPLTQAALVPVSLDGKERGLGKVTLLNQGEFQKRDVSSQGGGTPHSWENKSISYEASPGLSPCVDQLIWGNHEPPNIMKK